MSTRLLTEWLDENCHRAYPLDITDNSADVFHLPDDFLVDALILYTGAADDASFFISKIINDGSSINIELSCDLGVIGYVENIPFTTARYTEVSFTLKNATLSIVVVGKLTIGNVHSMDSNTGVYTLTIDTGKIYSGCVLQHAVDIAGIQVDDLIMTGLIQLQEGDGIQLTPKTVGGAPCIEISSTTSAGATSTIVDDASLLSALIGSYGTPIRSINGVLPASDGNIQISPPSYIPEGTAGCIEVVSSGTSGVLVINNTCSEPCCDDSELQVVIDNISTLNATVARINAFVTNLDTSINIVNTQLASL